MYLKASITNLGGMWWRSRLRLCATSWKVAGSIPDGVIGNFHWHNPSGRTMALGLNQPLPEMSTRNISWGVKAASVYSWQPYHLHVPIVMTSGSLNLLEPSGPVQGCNGTALALLLLLHHKIRNRGRSYCELTANASDIPERRHPH